MGSTPGSATSPFAVCDTSPFRTPALVCYQDVLYVADYSNNCVRVVSKGGVVATLTCHEVC